MTHARNAAGYLSTASSFDVATGVGNLAGNAVMIAAPFKLAGPVRYTPTNRLVVTVDAIAPRVASSIDSIGSNSGLYRVGPYDEIRGTVQGLDAHHVGQKAIMSRMIAGYDPLTAPAILVPKVGHTIRSLERGMVSRSATGLATPRAVVARDIIELRRVYPEIPNLQLQQLIKMNKNSYPHSFIKGK